MPSTTPPGPSPFMQVIPQHESTPTPPTPVPQPAIAPQEPNTPVTLQPTIAASPRTPARPSVATQPPTYPTLQQVTPIRKTAKLPLALRRLASFNVEGKKGLGEYQPSE